MQKITIKPQPDFNPNVYNDMLYNRLVKNEANWGKMFDDIWQARIKNLPPELRLEDNLHHDVGLKPLKQNWFRETGEVVCMREYDSVFQNSYNITSQKVIKN